MIFILSTTDATCLHSYHFPLIPIGDYLIYWIWLNYTELVTLRVATERLDGCVWSSSACDVYRLRQRKTQLSLIEFGFVVWQIESFKVNLLDYLCLLYFYAPCLLFLFFFPLLLLLDFIVVELLRNFGRHQPSWVKCKSWLNKTLSWLQHK